MADDQFKDLFGKQGFPQDCFQTCGKPECFLDGCARLALKRQTEADDARAEQLLKEARAH